MTERERIEKFLESIAEDNVRDFFNTLIEMCNVEEMMKKETYDKYKIDIMIEDGVYEITKDIELDIYYEMIKHYIICKPIYRICDDYYILTKNGWSQGYEITNNHWRCFIEMIMTLEKFKPRDISLIQKKLLIHIKITEFAYDVIQLTDCYIRNGKVFNGFYKEAIHGLNINRKITDDVDCDVALDLINHLCNGDEKVVNCLLDEIASTLILNEDFKERNGRLLRLYGDGENGKFTLIKFLRKVFDVNNFLFTELDKMPTTGKYQIEDIAHSLFVVDEDTDNVSYDRDTSQILNSLIPNQQIITRKAYRRPKKIYPICKIIVTSKYLFSDNEREYIKRITYQVEVKNKLERTDEWFNQLFSEKECQAFFNLCIKRMEKIIGDFNKGIGIKNY